MQRSLRRHPGPRIASVLATVFVAVVGLQPTTAQRPPVGPPGGNTGKQTINPIRPAPQAPSRPDPSGKHGIVGTGRPATAGQPGAPRFEMTWHCSNCNEELERGPDKPNIKTCPKCGVTLDPDYAPKNPVNKTNSYPVFNSVPTIALLGFAFIGFLVAVVVIVVLMKWALG
jgi:hypothetical protein